MFALIRSLFFIALAAGVFFVYTNPTYKEAQAVAREAATYNQALDSSVQFDSKREEIGAVYRSFAQGDIERLKAMVPSSVDNVRLVIDLQEITARSGMVFRRVTYDAEAARAARDPSATVDVPTTEAGAAPGTLPAAARKVEDNKPYGTFALTLTVSGTYDQFLAFLARLEQSLRIIDVVGATFSTPTDERQAAEGIYEYTVTLNTYWLKN